MADKNDSLLKELLKGGAGAVGAAAVVWLMGWWRPLWSFTQSAFTSAVTHLMAQSQWPNWSAYLVSALAFFTVLSWAFRYLRSRKDSTARFNQFSFLGSVWRWKDMSSLPYGLTPYCPSCDMLLVYEESGGGFYSGEPRRVALHCERCSGICTNEAGDMNYLRNRVTREIDRLVRTGDWRQHVAQQQK